MSCRSKKKRAARRSAASGFNLRKTWAERPVVIINGVHHPGLIQDLTIESQARK